MGSARTQPQSGILRANTTSDLQPPGPSREGSHSRSVIPSPEHYNMSTNQPVPTVKRRIIFGRLPAFEIRHQPRPLICQAPAHDLFDPSLMKIYTRPESAN